MRDVLLRSSLPSARYRSPNSAPSPRTKIECQSVSRETLVCVSSAGSPPRGPLAARLASRRPPRPSTPSLLHRTAPRHPQRPSPTAPRPDTRQSPRPAITSPPRCPSPRCLAAASVALSAAEPVVPAAPAAALPRGPPRATSRRPHRDPPPDAHASPPSPYPTLALTHRACTRHSRRQRHALHVRTLTPYLAAASLPSARPHARRPPPAFGSNSRVFHVKHSFASHPHRTPNVL